MAATWTRLPLPTGGTISAISVVGDSVVVGTLVGLFAAELGGSCLVATLYRCDAKPGAEPCANW